MPSPTSPLAGTTADPVYEARVVAELAGVTGSVPVRHLRRALDVVDDLRAQLDEPADPAGVLSALQTRVHLARIAFEGCDAAFDAKPDLRTSMSRRITRERWLEARGSLAAARAALHAAAGTTDGPTSKDDPR